MSKSTVPHPCFYNNDYTYLVDLITEEKYTTSITMHYATRYYKEGIEDMIPERWSEEVHRYHFEALNVRRSDDKEYEFSYANLSRLSVNDVEDMYLLQVQDKVEDIQLGVESYQRTLNLTKPTMFFEGIDQRIPFTMTATHKGVVYLNQYNIKSLIKLSEVKKFCDGTLMKIQENLIDMLSKNKLGSGNKREQLRRLEEYVGGCPKTVNPRTFVRPIMEHNEGTVEQHHTTVEKTRYQNPFYLKQAQQKQQSLYNGRVLLEKHDPPAVYDLKETPQLAQESHLKMKQFNKEIKPANYAKINKLSEVFVSQKAKSREEVYFSNTSKTASVSNTISKPISIHDDEFSEDTPSVAQKFLNEVKDTTVTLQRVVKHRMSENVNNLSSPIHQEIHKIFKNKIFPIVNQVDAIAQNFENHFVEEAAKFVRDFKSLAKEADESLNKIMVLEKENEGPLKSSFYKTIYLGNPPSSSGAKLYSITPFSNTLSKPVTSHSIPKSQESKVVQNDKVIALGIFRTNPLKNSKNDKSKVICATFKQCLITANHDECMFKYVNGMNSSKKNQSANASESVNQTKHKVHVKKSKKLGSKERLASPRPSKPRTCLRWLPTGRIFNLCGKLTASSNTKSESDTFVCDNASASNPQEPTSKGFPNSTSFIDKFTRLWRQNILVDGVTTTFQLSRSQGHMLILKDQGYIQCINQDLKKALNFKDTLPQALINKNILKEHQAHEYNQEVSKFISRLKDQDIKIKSKDIKLKIKIQDHKRVKGIAKEFLRTQGSKIQDVTRSEALSAMTTL
ncbi:hypothetical protein Tco_0250303 [Tanacetum coccineum]